MNESSQMKVLIRGSGYDFSPRNFFGTKVGDFTQKSGVKLLIYDSFSYLLSKFLDEIPLPRYVQRELHTHEVEGNSNKFLKDFPLQKTDLKSGLYEVSALINEQFVNRWKIEPEKCYIRFLEEDKEQILVYWEWAEQFKHCRVFGSYESWVDDEYEDRIPNSERGYNFSKGSILIFNS